MFTLHCKAGFLSLSLSHTRKPYVHGRPALCPSSSRTSQGPAKILSPGSNSAAAPGLQQYSTAAPLPHPILSAPVSQTPPDYFRYPSQHPLRSCSRTTAMFTETQRMSRYSASQIKTKSSSPAKTLLLSTIPAQGQGLDSGSDTPLQPKSAFPWDTSAVLRWHDQPLHTARQQETSML